MRNISIGLIIVFFFTPCLADVHKFRGSDGSALLTNRQPEIRSGVEPNKAKINDLKPSSKSSSNNDVEYSYDGTKKFVPTTETVKVGARDVYRKGWCKINNSIVPCYNYEKTLPATSFQVESSKAVEVNPEKVLQDSINNSSE